MKLGCTHYARNAVYDWYYDIMDYNFKFRQSQYN